MHGEQYLAYKKSNSAVAMGLSNCSAWKSIGDVFSIVSVIRNIAVQVSIHCTHPVCLLKYLNISLSSSCQELALNSASICGPVAWNTLPATIRNTTDSKLFKRLLKSHFHNRSFDVLYKHYWLCNTLLDDFILYINVHQVTIVLYCIVLYWST